jgi:hypothetical protein
MLRIRLTDDERRILDAVAESNSQETSTWARNELLYLAKKRRQPEKGQK